MSIHFLQSKTKSLYWRSLLSGASSVVKMCRQKGTKQDYADKIMKKDVSCSENFLSGVKVNGKILTQFVFMEIRHMECGFVIEKSKNVVFGFLI